MTNKQNEKYKINRNAALMHLGKAAFLIAFLVAMPNILTLPIPMFILCFILECLVYFSLDYFIGKKIKAYKDRELEKIEKNF